MLKIFFGESVTPTFLFTFRICKVAFNFFTDQMSQTRLDLQVTLTMEVERKENQSEELDSSAQQEKSEETAMNGPVLAVSIKPTMFSMQHDVFC